MSLIKNGVNYKIRTANKGDANEIFYLVQRAFSSYGGKGFNPAVSEAIEDLYYDLENNIVLVVEYKNMITGSLRLCKKDTKKFYLKRFSIDPNFQDQGIGTILYYHAEKEVKKLAGEYIYLYSSTEDQRLISFYKKLGFICIKKDCKNGYERGFWSKKISGVDLSEIMGWKV